MVAFGVASRSRSRRVTLLRARPGRRPRQKRLLRDGGVPPLVVRAPPATARGRPAAWLLEKLSAQCHHAQGWQDLDSRSWQSAIWRRGTAILSIKFDL